MSSKLKITLQDNRWLFIIFLVAVLASLIVILGIIPALIYYEVLAPVSSDVEAAAIGIVSDNALLIMGILIVPAAIISWFLTRARVRNKRLEKRLGINQQLLEMVNDLIFIPKDTTYNIIGNLKFFLICSPEFNPNDDVPLK